MLIDDIVILTFGAFLFLGAFFGAKAGSKISLIMGVVSGSLIVAGDGITYFNKRAGLLFLMIVAGLLVVSFVQRVLKTKKMMPAGMLLIVSALFFGYTIIRFLNT